MGFSNTEVQVTPKNLAKCLAPFGSATFSRSSAELWRKFGVICGFALVVFCTRRWR